MNKSTSSDEYFATLEDPIRLADAMQAKIREYRNMCSSMGLMELWKNKLMNYYGISAGGNTSQSVTPGGSEGELSMIKVNDLHSLIQEQLVIVTSQRPAGQARAINSDTKSQKAARVGSAIAEYYMSQLGFEAKFVNVAECALLCDEAFVELFWDKTAGDPIAVDHETGLPEMSGDCILRVHAPWNAARDMGMKVESQTWKIFSYKDNKFDLAATYPNFADQILSCGQDSNLPSCVMDEIPDGSDAVWCHLLIHDRTAAVPNGRYSLLINDSIVLDTGLPFKPYPVERLSPSDVIEGAMGYAPANDIMGLEQLTDALHSIISSNEITFGGQNLVIAEGIDMKVSDLGKGLRTFEVPPDMVGKIQPLQLCHTPPEVFNYVGMIKQYKERAVGSVQSSLAQQAAQGASGNSMALIQSQAISYNSGTQRSYFNVLSGTMTKLIEILRTYADTPRVATIVGKIKSQFLKEYKYNGEDLNSISSIVYEMVNPASQTYGGRLTMAQDLLKAGQIKSPKQYINVVATGQIEVLTQDDEADGMLIMEENEALLDGRPVKAIITDMHADHYKSHDSLNTQEAREKDPDLVTRNLAHMQEHLDLWTQATQLNPAILAITGQPPAPIPQPPMGMSGPGGPPPGAPAGLGKMVGGGEPPPEVAAGEVKPPGLPNIAGTKTKPTVPGVTDQLGA